MRTPIAALMLLVMTSLLAMPARASDPSGACKDGAALCNEAVDRLEACKKKNAGATNACVGEVAEADNACKTTTSACHTDGSRQPPATTPGNAPKR